MRRDHRVNEATGNCDAGRRDDARARLPAEDCYHPGMTQEEHWSKQDSSMTKLRDALVVATIALGMSMYLTSIRYFYHLNSPKTHEGHIQDIGHAGREALIVLRESLVTIEDIPVLEQFICGETQTVRNIRLVVVKLFGESGRVLNHEYGLIPLTEQNTLLYSVLKCKLTLDLPRAPRRKSPRARPARA